MRATVSLRDDLALELERLRKERDVSFNVILNEAIEHGLTRMRQRLKSRKPVRTHAVDLGPLLYPSVKEALQAMDEEHDLKKLGLK